MSSNTGQFVDGFRVAWVSGDKGGKKHYCFDVSITTEVSASQREHHNREETLLSTGNEQTKDFSNFVFTSQTRVTGHIMTLISAFSEALDGQE